MPSQQTFCVAGQCFSLTLPEALLPLRAHLGNYAPFALPAAEQTADTAFSLVLADLSATPPDTGTDSQLLGTFHADACWLQLFSLPAGGRLIRMAPSAETATTQTAVLHISADFSQGRLFIPPQASAAQIVFALNNAAMLLFAVSTATRGVLLVHASVVTHEQRGYLFMGRSGTGKSTHSRLWLRHIAHTALLNDDNPALRIDDRGQAYVCGTPWSGKTPCYVAAEVPLGAIVKLQQAPYNRIQRLRPTAAYAAVLPGVSAMRWERTLADGLHHTLQTLVEHTAVFHLECLPDEGAALLCHQTVRPHRQPQLQQEAGT